MRIPTLFFIFLFFANVAVAQVKGDPLEAGARKASDDVMADLIADRTSIAIQKISPKTAVPEWLRTQTRKMLEN